MSESLLHFGEAIDLIPENVALTQIPKGLVTKGTKFKTMRLVLSAGEEIAEHQAQGELAVVCIAGHIHFLTADEMHHLGPGTLLCLSAGESHSVKAIEDSVFLVLVTI
jgi:quercetin dioxygenase-like cupin family protein